MACRNSALPIFNIFELHGFETVTGDLCPQVPAMIGDYISVVDYDRMVHFGEEAHHFGQRCVFIKGSSEIQE